MDIGKFVDWIKLSPRYLLPFLLVSGFLLFGPGRWLDGLGVSPFVSRHRPYIAVVLLLSAASLLTALAIVVGKAFQRLRFRRLRRNHLWCLPDEERVILRKFMGGPRSTLLLGMDDPAACELARKGIIYQSTPVSEPFAYYYNMSEWARAYLEKHPNLL